MATPPVSPSNKPTLKQAAASVRMAGKLSGITLPSTTPPPLGSIATIAIMSMPMIEVKYDGFTLPDSLCAAAGGINSFYVRWLEAAGVRCYILQWDDPWEKKLELLSKVKGVLLPGGDLDHFEDVLEAYFAEVRKVYEYTLDQNRNRNNPFFMWGTCQGFQLLCACGAESLDVIRPGYEGVLCKMMPLEFVPDTADARMFGTADTPADVLHSLRNTPSTLNVHRYGVYPATFENHDKLKKAFRVITTNVDEKGTAFVSSIEHRDANIFALQWHAEWPPFDYTNEAVVQSADSIRVSAYVAQFIRSRLVLCKHRFATVRDFERHVVERSPLSYEGFGWELYWTQASKKPSPRAAPAGVADAPLSKVHRAE